MDVPVIVMSVLALVLGGALVWALVARGRAGAAAAEARAEARRAGADAERLAGEVRGARDEAERKTLEVRELAIEKARLSEQLARKTDELGEHAKLEERFTQAFRAMTADALKASRAEFIEQARPVFEAAKKEHSDLVKPIAETLTQTRAKLAEMEEKRTASFASLTAQIDAMAGANTTLRQETERLTRALSRPEIRGRYGEIQLRRVAELAGMRAYCDFDEQATGEDESGNAVRPDMVVRLPNERIIAVDAKTNINAYIEAVNARDEAEREGHLERFARHVAEQAKKLSDKRYWTAWDDSPEFVVMFVPGDHFIDAALSRRPDLLEFAAEHRVILASPSTLIGLLRAVHVGWREHSITERADELYVLGKELHDRAATAFEHVSKLGESIRQTTERYNRVVGSIDTRLVPTLKRFEEAGAKSSKELAELKPVDGEARALGAGGE